MKTHYFIIIATFLLLAVLSSMKLPNISFPEFAHHNTFGELPFVEVMDDGDFYEKDGAEYYSYYSSCVGALTDQCRENQDCVRDVTKVCNGKHGVPKCDDLEKLGDLYFPGTGLFFTCDIDFNMG